MKRYIFIPVLITVVLVAIFVFTGNNKQSVVPNGPSPTPYQLETLNSWGGVAPGASTRQTAIELLGQPESVKTDGKTQKLLYASGNKFWKNEVIVSDDRVVFIREYIFSTQERSYKKLSSAIKEAPAMLYGPDYTSGYILFAYPSSGIAYLVNNSRDAVYETWRFPSSSLKELLLRPEFNRYGVTPSSQPE